MCRHVYVDIYLIKKYVDTDIICTDIVTDIYIDIYAVDTDIYIHKTTDTHLYRHLR